MAGHLGLTLRQYRALEAGELWIDNNLYERIVGLCGWPPRESVPIAEDSESSASMNLGAGRNVTHP